MFPRGNLPISPEFPQARRPRKGLPEDCQRSRAGFMAVVPPSAEGTYRCSLGVISESQTESPPGALPRERDSKEIRSAGFMARGRLAVPF